MLGLSHNQITMLLKYVCGNYEKRIPAKHETPIKRRINAGPPSTTLAQHRLNTRWTSRACWDVSKRKREKSECSLSVYLWSHEIPPCGFSLHCSTLARHLARVMLACSDKDHACPPCLLWCAFPARSPALSFQGQERTLRSDTPVKGWSTSYHPQHGRSTSGQRGPAAGQLSPEVLCWPGSNGRTRYTVHAQSLAEIASGKLEYWDVNW